MDADIELARFAAIDGQPVDEFGIGRAAKAVQQGFPGCQQVDPPGERMPRAFDPGAVRRAMFHGSVMASFCVEGVAHDRLRGVTMTEIEARYTAFCDLTHFETLHL